MHFRALSRLMLGLMPALAATAVVATPASADAAHPRVASARFVASPRAVSTTGSQSVAVVLADWTSPDSQKVDDVVAAIGSASNWFTVVSGGRMSLSVTKAVDWTTIPDPGGCNSDTIFSSAVSHAGINPADYQHVVVYFPSYASCSWAGLGSEPGNQVWLNGWTDTSVVTHEIGHNLGLWHAHALSCAASGGSQPDTATVAATCLFPAAEYGDPADTMGNEGGNGAPWYDAPHLAQLGWLGGDQFNATPCSGQVHLAPLESPGATRVVAVDAGAEVQPQRPGVLTEPVTYWLEQRQPNGLDAGLGTGLTSGVLLHMTDPQWTTTTHQDFGTHLLDGTADGQGNFGDSSIQPGSTVATPQGFSIHVDAVDGGGATVTLSTSLPSVPRGVAAIAAGNGVKVSWQPPACQGTGGVTAYTVTALNDDGSSAYTLTTSTTSVTLPIAPTTDRQILVSAKDASAAYGPSAVAPVSAPVFTDVFAYTSPSLDQFQVTIAPSVANGGNYINGYQVHAVGPDGDKGSYIRPGENSAGTFPVIHGATYTLTVAPIIRADGTEGTPSAPVTMIAGDDVPPSVSIQHAGSNWLLGSSATVGWSASDSGGSGFASYDVRTRTASATTGLSGWAYPSGLQGTSATSINVALAAGATSCYAVRARDHNGNVSGWSRDACWSRPLDDRALTASTGWSRGTGSAYYAHTITTTGRTGAALSRTKVHAAGLLLLVTKCKGCGTVAVYEGTRLVTKLALAAATTRNRVPIMVTLPTVANGAKISLRVLTSGKPVRIDALGFRP